MSVTEWAVKSADGTPVTTLTGLAAVLGTGTDRAARTLAADRVLLDAAPPRLQAEVKAKFQKGGGDKPPPIASGSYVSWSGGKGRVDLVVTNGKVPGVDGDVEGSAKTPAARVVVWENDKPTRKKIAKSTHTLKRIPPIGGFAKKSLDPAEGLIGVWADYAEHCEAVGLPAHARVTGRAVKAVYDRGVRGWPGAAVTALSAEEWALGRVEHFIKAASGELESKSVCHDVDLLAADHPLRPQSPPPGTVPDTPPPGTAPVPPPGSVVLDAAEVKALLDGLT